MSIAQTVGKEGEMDLRTGTDVSSISSGTPDKWHLLISLIAYMKGRLRPLHTPALPRVVRRLLALRVEKFGVRILRIRKNLNPEILM